MSTVLMPAIIGLQNENVLVIGESYYNEDGTLHNEAPHNVPNIIREMWLDAEKDKKGKFKYYHLIEEFLVKYRIAESLVDVTFYNYVQQLMSKSSEKPKKEDNFINQKAFFQTIREVEPESILVFSLSTYNALPKESKSHDIKFVRRSDVSTKSYIFKSTVAKKYCVHWGYYEIDGKLVPVLGLPHLSRINSQLIENKVIEELLSDSGIIK